MKGLNQQSLAYISAAGHMDKSIDVYRNNVSVFDTVLAKLSVQFINNINLYLQLILNKIKHVSACTNFITFYDVKPSMCKILFNFLT